MEVAARAAAMSSPVCSFASCSGAISVVQQSEIASKWSEELGSRWNIKS